MTLLREHFADLMKFPYFSSRVASKEIDRPFLSEIQRTGYSRGRRLARLIFCLNAALIFAALSSGHAEDPNSFGFNGYEYDKETGIYKVGDRYYDPKMGQFLQQDSYMGDISNPPSLNRYTYAHNNPTKYTDPTGHDVEVIIGRPYVGLDDKEHPYGHVAVRVYDPSPEKKYDKAYDFGRYGRTSATGMSGEGILNVQKGGDYIRREAKERTSIGYIVPTTSDVDQQVMDHYQDEIDDGQRRRDIERRLSYSNSHSYQLQPGYDLAPITGIGRNTCVTQSAGGCQAGSDPSLNRVASALDTFRPQQAEVNLENLSRQPNSPISDRRTYRKNFDHVTITERDLMMNQSSGEVARERQARERAWNNPGQ